MPVPLTPPIDVTPPASEWTTVDLSPHLAEGDHDPRVGFFEVRNITNNYQPHVGIRCIDSKLDTRARTWDQTSHWRYPPIRERQVEIYADPGTEVYFHGYVDRRVGGSHFVPKRLPTTVEGQWYTLDATEYTHSETTPTMVFVRFTHTNEWGFRRFGAKAPWQSHRMYGRSLSMLHAVPAFCDDQGKFQVYVQNAGDVRPYLTGWVDERMPRVKSYQISAHPLVEDEWHTTTVSSSVTNPDDVVWLFQGNNHYHATDETRVRVAARTTGTTTPHYLHAGLVQWRPVQLADHQFDQIIERLGAENEDGGGTWILGRTGKFEIPRDDPDPDDPTQPDDPSYPGPPSDPADDLRPIGAVRADMDGEKVDIPVFTPDQVDGACLRIALQDTEDVATPSDALVGAFALAPRGRAAFPNFTLQTDAGLFGLHDLDVEFVVGTPGAPTVETGDATDITRTSARLAGLLKTMGDYNEVDVEFQLREETDDD